MSNITEAERDARKLRKDLERITDAVLLFLDRLDSVGSSLPNEAGSQLAKLANWLDMQNDGVRYSGLGVDFRKDDKKRKVRKLIEKARKASSREACAEISGDADDGVTP